jgi:hypothetical protein
MMMFSWFITNTRSAPANALASADALAVSSFNDSSVGQELVPLWTETPNYPVVWSSQNDPGYWDWMATQWSLQTDYIPNYRSFMDNFNQWCLDKSVQSNGIISPSMCINALHETVLLRPYDEFSPNSPCICLAYSYANASAELHQSLYEAGHTAMGRLLTMQVQKHEQVSDIYECNQAIQYLSRMQLQLNAEFNYATDTHWVSHTATQWLQYAAVDLSIWGQTLAPIVRVTTRNVAEFILNVVGDVVLLALPYLAVVLIVFLLLRQMFIIIRINIIPAFTFATTSPKGLTGPSVKQLTH